MPRRSLTLLLVPLAIALASPAAADEPPAAPPAPPPAAPPATAAPPAYAPPAYAPPSYPPGYAPPAYPPPGYPPPGYAPPAPWPAPQAYPAPYAPYPQYAPPAPAPASGTTYRSSTALGFGIVLLCLGAITAASTAPFLHAGPQTCSSDGSGFQCSTQGIDNGLIALTAVSGAEALAGIPLIVYGAGRVSVSGANGREGAGTAPPRWAGAPGANGWRWSF
jgi:hypothetical protein